MFIDILLPTYNGESYIGEQIDSIIEQSFEDWRLLIRDDGSSDATVAVLENYSNKYPGKIIILQDDKGNVGVKQSFTTLLASSDASYIAFCDQDDFWLKDKLFRQVEVLKECERKYGRDTPLLIQSDLNVVNSKLQLIDDSFWHYQKLDPARMNKPNVLLVHNFVTGCGCIFNRALVNKALPVPSNAIMHDWWFGLVASLTGKIISMDDKLVLYRQHQKNQVGAKQWGLKSLLSSLNPLSCRDIRLSLKAKYLQAAELLNIQGISQSNRQMIEVFSRFPEMNWVSRKVMLAKFKIHMFGRLRNLVLTILT